MDATLRRALADVLAGGAALVFAFLILIALVSLTGLCWSMVLA